MSSVLKNQVARKYEQRNADYFRITWVSNLAGFQSRLALLYMVAHVAALLKVCFSRDSHSLAGYSPFELVFGRNPMDHSISRRHGWSPPVALTASSRLVKMPIYSWLEVTKDISSIKGNKQEMKSWYTRRPNRDLSWWTTWSFTLTILPQNVR